MLFPPEYPACPEAPLLAFGIAFSEEISRTLMAAVWLDNLDDPRENEIRIAAALTMLEAFYPRDHLEVMMAAQGVAAHAMIMDCHRRVMNPNLDEATAIKLRGNIAQISRVFSTSVHDMERRQSKPLPRRPLPPADRGPGENPPDDSDGSPGGGTTPKPRAAAGTRARAVRKSAAKRAPAADTDTADADTAADGVTAPAAGAGRDPETRRAAMAVLEELAERPLQFETRPDGTPGSLSAYVTKPPEPVYDGRAPAIMMALATRPKPWRMVNEPAAPAIETNAGPDGDGGFGAPGGREDHLGGDSLARFAAARMDPDAPEVAPNFDDEYCEVELELLSTGGDPALEAHRQELIAAHPEGRPVRVIKYGFAPAPEGDSEEPDVAPPDG